MVANGAQRVVVLYRGSLLAEGVASVLGRVPRLEVRGVDLDEPAAADAVRGFGPSTVVFDGDDLRGEGDELVSRLLDEEPEIRVLCLRSTGHLDVYSRSRSQVSGSAELARAVFGS